MINNANKSLLAKQKQDNLTQLSKLIFNTLLKPTRWYTGSSIKTWIRANLFLPDLGQVLNSNFQTNRWSAYCHFNLNVSFANLIDKLNPNPNINILIHPLLESSLVQVLIGKSLKPIFFDISKDNLTYKAEDFLNYLQNNTTELVVLPIFNGLARDAEQIIKICNERQIRVLIYLPEMDLTADLYRLITLEGVSAVIYKTGPSWFPTIINQITRPETVIEKEDWHISWFLENRINSSNEIHLGSSQLAFADFLEQIHYLLTQKIKKFKWTELFVELFAKYVLYKNIDKNSPINIDKIEKKVWDNWVNIQKFALPDMVFEVPQSQTMPNQSRYVENKIFQWSQMQLNSKKIYNLLINLIHNQPEGSMEVPIFYLDQVYLYYHFFSTETESLDNFFKAKGFRVKIGFEIHPLIQANLANLPNTSLATKFCIQLRVPDRDLNI